MDFFLVPDPFQILSIGASREHLCSFQSLNLLKTQLLQALILIKSRLHIASFAVLGWRSLVGFDQFTTVEIKSYRLDVRLGTTNQISLLIFS